MHVQQWWSLRAKKQKTGTDEKKKEWTECVSELENGSSNDKNFCIRVLYKVENALRWICKLTQLYDTFARNQVVVAHISDNIIL